MYRALYDYQGTKKDETLTIKAGEVLALIDKTNEDWWRCQRLSSKLSNPDSAGYVPVTYLKEVEVSHGLQAELNDARQALQSIDRAIEFIHTNAAQSRGTYTTEMRDNLLKLTQHRRNYVTSNSALASLAVPIDSASQPDIISSAQVASSGAGNTAKALANEEMSPNISLPIKKSSSKKLSVKGSKAPLPPGLGSQPQKGVDTAQSPQTARSAGSHQRSPKAVHQPKEQQQSLSAQDHQPVFISANKWDTESSPKMPKEATDKQQQSQLEYKSPKSQRKGEVSIESSIDGNGRGLESTVAESNFPQHASKVVTPSVSNSSLDTCHIADLTGRELMETVRKKTSLSYSNSKLAVTCILQKVAACVPEISTVMARIVQTLPNVENTDDNTKFKGHDYERLQVIFEEMTSCKDDSQQRSWALYEDQSIISEYLNELITLLTDADPAVSKEVVKGDDYQALDSLVSYYQMEPRVSLRILLLKVFGALCELSADIISHLLNTVLPMELARDMVVHTAHLTPDLTKLNFSALLMVMILSQGEALPYTHYQHLNENFIITLFDWIENHTFSEDFTDLCISLILAFNLHFVLPEDNCVMKVIAKIKFAKTFSEKILLLINSQEDPVRLFDHQPQPPNSVIKLLADIFSSETTSGIFYTNDLKVLIDIIIRQLSDLPAGDQMRTENLSLIYDIIKFSSYHTNSHRLSELKACFKSIVVEEGTKSDQDKLIVQKILNEFSQYFSK